MKPLSPRRQKRQKGAVAVEYVVVGLTLVLPMTFAIIFSAQLLWIWHGVSEMTREGAHYAATHCYQGGTNVRNHMQSVVPPMPNQEQFRGGTAEINITYFARDPETGDLIDFTCDTQCSLGCVPDLVRVEVSQFEFRSFLQDWGISPVPIPNFQTTVPMEGAGCDPDTGSCLP